MKYRAAAGVPLLICIFIYLWGENNLDYDSLRRVRQNFYQVSEDNVSGYIKELIRKLSQRDVSPVDVEHVKDILTIKRYSQIYSESERELLALKLLDLLTDSPTSKKAMIAAALVKIVPGFNLSKEFREKYIFKIAKLLQNPSVYKDLPPTINFGKLALIVPDFRGVPFVKYTIIFDLYTLFLEYQFKIIQELETLKSRQGYLDDEDRMNVHIRYFPDLLKIYKKVFPEGEIGYEGYEKILGSNLSLKEKLKNILLSVDKMRKQIHEELLQDASEIGKTDKDVFFYLLLKSSNLISGKTVQDVRTYVYWEEGDPRWSGKIFIPIYVEIVDPDDYEGKLSKEFLSAERFGKELEKRYGNIKCKRYFNLKHTLYPVFFLDTSIHPGVGAVVLEVSKGISEEDFTRLLMELKMFGVKQYP